MNLDRNNLNLNFLNRIFSSLTVWNWMKGLQWLSYASYKFDHSIQDVPYLNLVRIWWQGGYSGLTQKYVWGTMELEEIDKWNNWSQKNISYTALLMFTNQRFYLLYLGTESILKSLLYFIPICNTYIAHTICSGLCTPRYGTTYTTPILTGNLAVPM